jgi:cytochrome P450
VAGCSTPLCWRVPKRSVSLTGTLLEAGSDTTVSALCSLVLGLLHFPEVIDKVHEELDRVIGSLRMPSWEE